MSASVHVMPDMRIVHPEYGDISEDVARELAALRHQAHDVACLEAERRQRKIAAAQRESRIDRKTGMRLVAQIDEDVFNYWESREGAEFWKHELPFMMKRHPEIAVKPVSDRPTVLVDGFGRAVA